MSNATQKSEIFQTRRELLDRLAKITPGFTANVGGWQVTRWGNKFEVGTWGRIDNLENIELALDKLQRVN